MDVPTAFASLRDTQEVLSARNTAEWDLEGAAMPPPSTIDLAALALALEIGRDAGASPQLVERCQSKLDAVIEQRRQAEEQLEEAKARRVERPLVTAASCTRWPERCGCSCPWPRAAYYSHIRQS